MNEILGKDWHKELASSADEKAAVREEFYEKRAELKDAINEDLADLRLDKTAVTAEGKYLFGVLEKAFGMKKAYKILKVASAEGSGFNVDQFKKGDTVSIEQEENATYLVKRNTSGEELEKALLSDVMPVEAATRPEEVEAPEETGEVLRQKRAQVLSVSERIVDGTGITIEVEEATLNPHITLSLDGRTALVKIQHNEGVSHEEAFKRGNYTAHFNGQEFENFGEAVRVASLELKPEPTEAPAFSVDETLSLLEQWNVWRTEIIELVVAEGMFLEIKNEGPGRVKFLVHYADREEGVTIQRHLTAKGGGYTSKHATITYAAQEFKDPLAAVQAVIADLKRPKEKLKITPPWQRHGHSGEGASHDGHSH